MSSSNPVVKVLVSPMSSMALMLGLVQVARRIDLKDPQIIMYMRFSYGISQVLGLLFCLWLRSKINSIADKKHFVEVEVPAKPFSDEEPTKKKMTVQEYDLEEVGKQIQQVLVSSAILIAIHSYFGYAQPLFLQSILPWKNLLTLPVVRVHLFGCKAVGDLARPWKPASPFGDFANAAQEAKKEVEEVVEKVEEKKEETAKPKGKKEKKND